MVSVLVCLNRGGQHFAGALMVEVHGLPAIVTAAQRPRKIAKTRILRSTKSLILGPGAQDVGCDSEKPGEYRTLILHPSSRSIGAEEYIGMSNKGVKQVPTKELPGFPHLNFLEHSGKWK